jgi:hypothetical protein
VIKNGGSTEDFLPASACSVLEGRLEKEQNAEGRVAVSKVKELVEGFSSGSVSRDFISSRVGQMIFDESEMLFMSGPYGDSVQYKNGEPTKQFAKCDGVRILSNSSMIVIHRVSVFITSSVGIGNKIPAALLYNVRDHYGRQNKDSVQLGITGLTQWWLNAFSSGNSGMAVQSQPNIQRNSMNKLRGLSFRMVYDKGKENIVADTFSQGGSLMATYGDLAIQIDIPKSIVTNSYALDKLPIVTIHSPHGVVYSVQWGKVKRLHQFGKQCLVSEQAKEEQQLFGGFWHLFSVLQGIWKGLKSDFLEDFPIPEGCDFIMLLQCVAQDHLPRWKTLPPFVELWYRPDKNASNPEASELFKEVAYSYNILSDPEKQRQYDNADFEAFENEGVDMEIELSNLGTVNKCLQHFFSKLGVPMKTIIFFYCAGKGHEWHSYGETTPCWKHQLWERLISNVLIFLAYQ